MSYKKLCLLKNFSEEISSDEPYTTPPFGIPMCAVNHTLHIIVTPDGENYPTSLNISLEGSIDGSNWFELASSTNIEGEVKIFTAPIDFIRVKINELSFSEGTTPSLTIWYIGK